MNGLFQTQDKGFGSFIVIQNDLIGNFINQNGFWENHLCHIYNNLIKETDIVVDAGANIGFHTVQFAKKAKKVARSEIFINIDLCLNLSDNIDIMMAPTIPPRSIIPPRFPASIGIKPLGATISSI